MTKASVLRGDLPAAGQKSAPSNGVLVDPARLREFTEKGWTLFGGSSVALRMRPPGPGDALRPIETVYAGHLFRSRTEARWAVFFTKLGIRFQYEAEGYDLGDGIWYLPDFYIPEWEAFIEVKGADPTHEERVKAERLALLSKHKVIVVVGAPADQCGFMHDQSGERFDFWGDEVGIARGRKCDCLMVAGESWYANLTPCQGLPHCADKWPARDETIEEAIKAATQERFSRRR